MRLEEGWREPLFDCDLTSLPAITGLLGGWKAIAGANMDMAGAVDGASARAGFGVVPCRTVVLSGLVQVSHFCHNISFLPHIVAVCNPGSGLANYSRAIVSRPRLAERGLSVGRIWYSGAPLRYRVDPSNAEIITPSIAIRKMNFRLNNV